MEERELLDVDMYDREYDLVEASKGKRFANYLLDYIAAVVMAFLLFLLLDVTGLYSLEVDQPLLDRLIGVIAYLCYYLIVEAIFNGKSLAKFITKTRVVQKDGHPIEFSHVLARSFSRLVPFEPFSFLGELPNGWHDRWSKTIVIDENLSQQ